jgi:hypothetical protein
LQHPENRDLDEPAAIFFLFPAILAPFTYPENSEFSANSHTAIYIHGSEKTSRVSGENHNSSGIKGLLYDDGCGNDH